jgi:hypothetical protein
VAWAVPVPCPIGRQTAVLHGHSRGRQVGSDLRRTRSGEARRRTSKQPVAGSSPARRASVTQAAPLRSTSAGTSQTARPLPKIVSKGIKRHPAGLEEDLWNLHYRASPGRGGTVTQRRALRLKGLQPCLDPLMAAKRIVSRRGLRRLGLVAPG